MIADFRNKLQKLKGLQEAAVAIVQSTKNKIRSIENEKEDIEQARLVLQTVAQQTQQELEYRVAEIVSLALQTVFDEPYELKLDFIIKRGKTEADIYFELNGERLDPMTASGGGPVDITAFALRVALWSLRKPRTRNVIIIDEPFKYLSPNYHERAAQMLNEISHKLGLQIIMVTYSQESIQTADRVFRVKQIKGVSEIK